MTAAVSDGEGGSHEAAAIAEIVEGSTERAHRLTSIVSRHAILIYLIVVLVVFSIVRPRSFATFANYQSTLAIQAVVVIVALGAAVSLVIGEMDLSIANNTALAGAVIIGLQVNDHLSWPLAVLVTLIISVLIGLVNAIVVVRFHVPSFVATLGMYTLLEGAWTYYLNGQTLVPLVQLPSAFYIIGRGTFLGLGAPVYIAFGCALVAWVVTTYLPLGRRAYATGGNRDAARLSGIRTTRIIFLSFLVSGFLAGIAGIILGSEYGNAAPGAGSELLFPALAGVFLGATTVRVGRYNVVGTVISVYAIAFLISGLQQLGGVWAEQWVNPVFDGLFLILAVALSVGLSRQRDRRVALERLKSGREREVLREMSKSAVTEGKAH
jgi:ribose transport system permease protein